MNNIDENISSNEEHDFLKHVKVPFKQSKEEIWKKITANLEENSQPQKEEPKIIQLSWYKYAAAATITLLIVSSLFLRLSITNIDTIRGEHLSHILPDGSKIILNAETSISYYPYWWKVTRALTFEGEAFFEVKKGSNFTVSSENGITKVLGTSFNINSRNNSYKVFCATGKVQVSNPESGNLVILSPNMQANLNDEKSFIIHENISSENLLSWTKNEYIFTAEPLNNVFHELELQYNIDIIIDIKNLENIKYTGMVSKSQPIDTALNLICQSFNFSFVKQSDKKYLVLKNE